MRYTDPSGFYSDSRGGGVFELSGSLPRTSFGSPLSQDLLELEYAGLGLIPLGGAAYDDYFEQSRGGGNDGCTGGLSLGGVCGATYNIPSYLDGPVTAQRGDFLDAVGEVGANLSDSQAREIIRTQYGDSSAEFVQLPKELASVHYAAAGAIFMSYGQSVEIWSSLGGSGAGTVGSLPPDNARSGVLGVFLGAIDELRVAALNEVPRKGNSNVYRTVMFFGGSFELFKRSVPASVARDLQYYNLGS